MLRMAGSAIENTFREQLEQLRVSNKKSLLLSKEDYFNLIEEMKVTASCGDKMLKALSAKYANITREAMLKKLLNTSKAIQLI